MYWIIFFKKEIWTTILYCNWSFFWTWIFILCICVCSRKQGNEISHCWFGQGKRQICILSHYMILKSRTCIWLLGRNGELKIALLKACRLALYDKGDLRLPPSALDGYSSQGEHKIEVSIGFRGLGKPSCSNQGWHLYTSLAYLLL